MKQKPFCVNCSVEIKRISRSTKIDKNIFFKLFGKVQNKQNAIYICPVCKWKCAQYPYYSKDKPFNSTFIRLKKKVGFNVKYEDWGSLNLEEILKDKYNIKV